jgi:hypothetical protein
MTLEESILQDISKEMSKSVDFSILAKMLCNSGWVEAHIKYYGPQQTWAEMIQWADKNCEGEFKEHHGHWLFANPKDATMFILRWGS